MKVSGAYKKINKKQADLSMKCFLPPIYIQMFTYSFKKPMIRKQTVVISFTFLLLLDYIYTLRINISNELVQK